MKITRGKPTGRKLRQRLGIRQGMSLLLLASLVLTVAAVVSVTEPAEAQFRCGTEHYYYSDPGMTNLIGVQVWTPWSCGCNLFQWGDISPYREILDGFC